MTLVTINKTGLSNFGFINFKYHPLKPQIALPIFLLFICLIATSSFAQVGIGTGSDAPNTSSMLEIKSNSKGVLIPRMLSVQRNGISSPADGLLVYDTDTDSFWYAQDNAWKELVVGGGSFAGNIKIGDGTNNTYIESDGSLSYQGSATRWDDLKVPVNSLKIKGTVDEAKWDVFIGSTALLWFENNKSQDVVFTLQMPHAWKEGSDIFPHVHWTTGKNGSGSAPGSDTVEWNLEYSWASVGEVFPGTTINTKSTVAAPNTGDGHVALKEHVITPLGSIAGTFEGVKKTLSSMLVCRLYRSASDSYGGDAGLLEIDFHYEIDSDGSRQEYTK